MTEKKGSVFGIIVGIATIVGCVAAVVVIPEFRQWVGLGGSRPTEIPQPTPTPDLTNLYTYFPHPNIGSTRTYNYSYIYSDPNQNSNAPEQKKVTGSYTETVKIVNDVQIDKQVAIVGVEITDRNYLARCPDNFFWYVYDPQRLYVICSKDYVYDAAADIASSREPDLVINNQYVSQPLDISPVYLTPFDIGKYWGSEGDISVEAKVNKTISLGTFSDCFQLRFWAVNYEEFRYLCPKMGVVAIEVFDHSDYYYAELVSVK